jgi:hypothetical protein
MEWLEISERGAESPKTEGAECWGKGDVMSLKVRCELTGTDSLSESPLQDFKIITKMKPLFDHYRCISQLQSSYSSPENFCNCLI